MRFYLNKIGGHFQELAILALVFVPLERSLTHPQIVELGAACAAIIVAGIEMERGRDNGSIRSIWVHSCRGTCAQRHRTNSFHH